MRRYERRSIGLASHWQFEDWGTFLPIIGTAAAMLDRLLDHSVARVTEALDAATIVRWTEPVDAAENTDAIL